jgi:fatty acid desaturase
MPVAGSPAPSIELQSIAYYAGELRPDLPPWMFAPARSRLFWLPVHAVVIGVLAWGIVTGRIPALLWPLVSIAIGACMACTAFLGHETLHGGVVRGRWTIRIVGWLGLLPFTVSPQLWTAWHNRVHHGHCGQPGIDPDMYPTLAEYESQPAARMMADYFGIGRRRPMGFLSLLFGFTGQSTQVLFSARRRGYLTPRLHRQAIAETLLGVAFWTAVAMVTGLVPFLFVYVLPLVVANSIVMAFILTNHNLNPLTPVNDPLVNSLSVTLPRPLEWLTLRFGFHVEHHLFPAMSSRHGPAVREAVRGRWPERYQSMPMGRALQQLYRTARVYRDDVTLIDPRSGMTWPTLAPRELRA